jgi:hypothetical protein
VVAENDVETSLTPEEKQRIETESHPYAVIRPISGRPIGALLGGTTIHAVTRDVYLEHRNAPSRETLQKLRNQVLIPTQLSNVVAVENGKCSTTRR